MKTSYFALTSVSFLALSSPALAQQSTGTQDLPAQEQQAPAGATVANETAAEPGPANAADEETGNADIVVTATRRAERLQDVPLAVNAITGDQLAEGGFQNLTDIQYQISGVQFGTSPNDAGFRLRGVGTAGGFSSASEQNVGTVVDNVVIPFGNPVNSLGDLDRVEVLKGPQGTQFGKNSSSGVVNITTRKPDLDAVGGSAFASYAELNEYDVHGSINVPIVSGKAALNVYAFRRHNAGFLNNVVLDEKWGATTSFGTRAKLYWEPAEDFSVYLIGDYSKTKRKGPGQLWTLNTLQFPVDLPATNFFGALIQQARFDSIEALGITPGFNNLDSAEDYEGFGGEKNYGVSLELNKELGEFNLTSVSAYRKLDERPNQFSIDGFPFPIFTAQQSGSDQSYLSQEVRLTSPTGHPLQYVAGIYLSRRKSGYDSVSSAQLRPLLPITYIPGPPAPNQVSVSGGLGTSTTKTESAAAFVDGSFKIAEGLRALGGLRYSYDWVKATNFSVEDPDYPNGFGPNGFTIYPDGTPRPLQVGKVNKGDWSGRIGMEYKPTNDVMFYGTIARGYLGPTVTYSILTATKSVVDPQTVRDITLGFKTQWLDRKVTFNGNVFFDKYKNLQTSVFDEENAEFLTENAGGLSAKGFELETVFRPVRQLSLNASVTYSKTKFTEYVTACPNSVLVQGAAVVAAECDEPGSTPDNPLFDASGFPLSGAPKWSATAGADFNQPVGNGLLLDASVNYYYRSKVFYDVGNELSRHRGYGIFGGTIGFGDADGAWRVSVFGRNLFDKLFHSAIIGLPFSEPGSTVNWLTREGRRTIGVSGEVRF